MIVPTLRNVSPVFTVCALELWDMVVPVIPSATAVVKAILNNERLRVMRRMMPLGGGLPVSNSLKLSVHNWSVINERGRYPPIENEGIRRIKQSEESDTEQNLIPNQ